MKINLSKWLHLIEAFAPLVIASAAPELLPVAGAIIHGIQAAEQLHGATGAQKLKVAQELAVTTAQGINLAAGREAVPVDLVAKASASVISATVDAVNLVHGVSGKVGALPAVPVPEAVFPAPVIDTLLALDPQVPSTPNSGTGTESENAGATTATE